MKERPHTGVPFADAGTLPGPAEDEGLMREALAEARGATGHGDVPIGAVVARDGQVIARAHNRREIESDPTGHAELIALRGAARSLRRWRLLDCALYVTIEPCAMCAAGAVLARVALVVFAAPDEKAGAIRSAVETFDAPWANHRPRWRYFPPAREEAERLVQEFFAAHRAERD